MNVLDYIKYNFFNIRTPSLVEKVRLQEYAARIQNNKYHFVDLKTGALTDTLAKFVFDMYKVIGPLLHSLKEEFIIKDGKQFSYYLIEVSFNDEMKNLYLTLNKEYMTEKLKSGEKINNVFNDVKDNFSKFKKFISSDNGREINLTFNLLKDFAAISNFDFFLFLRAFCPSFVDGAYNSNPTFKSTSNIQVVDDLIRLDEAVKSIVIRKELASALKIFQKYIGVPEIPENNIKTFLARVKYLQTPNLLSDIIIYLLKDFTYKSPSNSSNVNIFVNYITDCTNNLKKDMNEIVSEIKANKITTMREKTFSGIEIMKMSNINDDKNELLEKYECNTFSCIEPLEYIKTFVVEIFDIKYKSPLNDMFLGVDFVNKERNSMGLDAFYTLNDSNTEIVNFDAQLSPESENFKRFKGWTITKNKALTSRELIEAMVKKLDDEGNKIIINAYNSVLDLTSIVKNVIEDYNNGTKNEILNANKIPSLEKFNLNIAKEMLDDFENFISLLKNFVR